MKVDHSSDFTPGRATLLSLARHQRLVRDNAAMRGKLESMKQRLKAQGRELKEARATIERLRSVRPMEASP